MLKRKLHLRTWGLLVVGGLPLLIAGCPLFPTPSGEAGDASLVPFTSSSELLTYFKEQVTARHRGSGFGGLLGFGGLAAPAAAEGDLTNGADADSAGGSNEQTFSTTNLQEAGVDESDVMKSDGTYFYIARGDTLRVVRADPVSALAEVGRLDLDVHVSEMYLYGSKLILLAQHYEEYGGGWGYPEIEIWPPYYVGSDLIVLEVDVSDPTAPAATRRIELDGSLVSSRLINDRVILVLTIAPQVPESPTPLAVSLLTLDGVMPKVRAQSEQRDMVQWENCLHPASPDGYFLTAVVTLDADDVESIVHSVAVLADAGTIYASTAALYVTDSEYGPNSNYREQTAIHKFAFDEDGAAQYVASGSVPGRLLNQFSLGEYEGYLRVATHVTNREFFGLFDDGVGVAVAEAPDDDEAVNNAQSSTAPAEFNAVYVLGQAGSELEVTGAVENVAPGEQLHAARFTGARGFLVTFRRIDPLFTLDLSDPTDPEVKGELVIPGYSDYLHPLGDDYLIGVGRLVVTMSSWGGEEPAACQLSLFDVSDPNNPTLVHQLELGGMHSWSYVSQTHKAFTLMPEQGLLALPVRLTDEDATYMEYDLDAFHGVVCLEVDPETGFTELGRLATVGWSSDAYEMWYPGREAWIRAAFIGDTLYVINADGVRAAPLSDFSATSEVAFP